MTAWPPLAAELPADRRRLATQLRRMLDRSTMTVELLAERTALPAPQWRAALDAEIVPPYGAVEVLAQASGADYARARALHRLAERAGGGPRPVPDPDPLDPLGPDEGLPRRRRALLPVTLGALAAAALAAVIVTAGPSTGRAPAGDAGAPPSGPAAAAAPDPTASPHTPARVNAPPEPGSSRTAPQAPLPSTPAAVPPLATMPPPTPGPPAYRSDPPPPSPTPPPPSVPSTGPVTVPPAAPTPAPPPPTTPPGPGPTPVCHGLLLLGICIG